jgi:choline dehydrogenase
MSRDCGTFDFIIVGGGTAGCVLAARLSEDSGKSVLLLEAGPPADSLWIGMPAGMGRLFVNPRYNWCYESEPEVHLGGRSLFWPQGKTLGGSSAINGMAFVRGQPRDYDDWAAGGAKGWGWDDVLPYFSKLESRSRSFLRGDSGPLAVSDPAYVHPSTLAFVASAAHCGVPLNPDYNGATQEGVSLLQFTIRDGRRASAATAYLGTARRRPNLMVLTNSKASRITFSGRRATGVTFRHGGMECQAAARGEVIVCAGAIGSPALLLASGIGDAQDLAELGIPLVHNQPAVGRHLVDHPYLHLTFGVTPKASLNPALRGWRAYLHGARWLLSRRGPLTIGASQAVAFVPSGKDAGRPDLQINFRPISHAFDRAGRLGPDPVPRVTAAICALRPRSTGRVWLKSADGTPAMIGGYASDRDDQDVLVQGFLWARRIFRNGPLGALVQREDKPGPVVDDEAAIRQFIKDTVQPMAHPVGTCRMGEGDDCVVDSRLSVRGIDGLRVIDSSIMPAIVSGNTVAATYMIAEKGADLIRAAAAA